MKKTLPGDVYERFKTALVDGGATSDEDQEAISKALYAWARERGAPRELSAVCARSVCCVCRAAALRAPCAQRPRVLYAACARPLACLCARAGSARSFRCASSHFVRKSSLP